MLEALKLDSVLPSPTNPRKRFDDKDLLDLAVSIKEHGVMQPILVRPVPGLFSHYEIVAGERRWRASKLAEQETIPAIIKELDNIETMQLQIIENLQRSDLHALEEAEGFRQMLNATGSDQHKPWTAEELGQKIGKSRSYVYASLKLCDMSNFAKDKFLEGKFGRETALLIARVPGEKLQEQLVKYIATSEMSFRSARDYIHRDFTFDLSKAQWDKFDEKLTGNAPSCMKCPKRSGNFPELFPDIESPDVCTDPTCYSQKKSAYADRIIKISPRVIHGEEAKQIAPYGVDSYVTNGYVKNLKSIDIDGFDAAEILGDEAPEPIPFVDDKKNVAAVYNIEEIKVIAAAVLQEKLASGELQADEEEPSEYEIKAQQRLEYAELVTPLVQDYYREQLIKARDMLNAGDVDYLKTFAKEAIKKVFYVDANRKFFFETLGISNLSECTVGELLLALVMGDFHNGLKLDKYDINGESFTITGYNPKKYLSTIESLTGVALPPLPAAQAQELNAESQAEAPGQREAEPLPETPAENPAEAVETCVNEDIAPGALPDVLPAETAVDHSPAAQAGESTPADAPLPGFLKAKLKGEKAAARRKAIQDKKVSGQPDAQTGADQVASANHAH
jgi:ParB/RepB/Spo0J family partition protein